MSQQTVDEAAPYGTHNGGGDVELHTMNRTSDDVEAGGIVHALPFPNESTVENPQQDGNDQQPAAEISDLKLLLLSNAITLPLTSVFAVVDWALGNLVLVDIPPFGSVSVWTKLEACAVGFAVVGPVTGLMATAAILVLRHPRHLLSSRSGRAEAGSPMPGDRDSDVNVVPVFTAICAPMSVLVMPLGFAMLPYLGTEAFGVRHALVVSTAGLGALSVVLLFVLGLAETVVLWCRAVCL